ncbi:MAG: cytochrome c biogenesis protein CcmE [Gemmatimonas sp.]|nr:cytochrome c biogenesis protein CcmE [Gemmatimonas sp.]
MTTKKTKWGAMTAVGVLVIAFGWLIYGGLDSNVVYFLTPKELLAKGADGYDKPMRLGGQVKPGSVVWDEQKLDLRFAVTDGTGEVVVHSKGAPPQMFKDGQGVVVEGRYGPDGVFKSTSVMVKHSNEYKAPAKGERPSDMYKSLMKSPAT